MRSDAQRNRKRVLEAAMETFATEGLSVPVAAIARRAGVGTGAVGRHFPMKDFLYEAIVLHLVGGIVDKARDLSAKNDPGSAFFQFLVHMVEQAAVNRGLAEAICGAGFDVEEVAFRPEHSLEAVESELLTRAQQAGAVRRDITRADVKALLVGCLARERQGCDPEARQRVIDVVCTGLRAEPGTPVCDDRGLAG
ncbi:TetR/AcrR family transcriptional regulator [Streptomyces spinoverrucosus]|uniref:TetR/AcrR family transcriptional regulator n=1 Tax=Streptomyces spinoverrucosus TaxID=284043 RepID=UPI0018C38C60|nr:TetR/AcrR family transcriptional regulator [Streptomyces spinoverrucosus]MBG0855713.1 TetR/AcrR family transcriptional regulator [Streptomyces spinoverrucosus]